MRGVVGGMKLHYLERLPDTNRRYRCFLVATLGVGAVCVWEGAEGGRHRVHVHVHVGVCGRVCRVGEMGLHDGLLDTNRECWCGFGVAIPIKGVLQWEQPVAVFV
jgi:hypothetical protein